MLAATNLEREARVATLAFEAEALDLIAFALGAAESSVVATDSKLGESVTTSSLEVEALALAVFALGAA